MTSRRFRSASPVALLATLVALAGLGLPASARAQAGLSHLDDATMVPQGAWRLQATTAWMRFDSRFLPAGASAKTSPLGADFSFDSMGVAQLPALTSTQTAVQQLSNSSPFQLSLGATHAAVDARVVVTPISMEYGVARWLTLGAMLPLVRTRMSIMMRVNADSASAAMANVGINPASVNAIALAQDSAVVQQMRNAAAALQTNLQNCQANPGANADCTTLLAREAEVSALVSDANSFATNFASVFGATSASRGAAVVPLAGSLADSLIRVRLVTFDSTFQSLSASMPRVTATPAAAGGPIGADDFNALLQNPGIAGFDSLKSSVHIAPGDLELSARVLLFDGFSGVAPTAHGGLHSRATLTATYRLPTGQLAAASNPLDIATGMGTSSLGLRLALYSQWGDHLGLDAGARYVAAFGQTKSGRYPVAEGAPFPATTADNYPYTPGNVMAFELAPRITIGPLIGVNVIYDYTHVAANDYASPPTSGLIPVGAVATLQGVTSAPGATQAAGFGFTYSTVTEFDRGKAPLPIDIGFTHLEALSGAAGMPRYFQDQIQLRFYYRRHRGH